jgi:3-hydroxymyristoyl/3-hydroxydecanoyl-(acyl carrier protein) dehydratase
MIADGEDVLKLIPQRPPIVMVDKLISAADKKTVSGFTILSNNIFVENGVFQEPGIIENVAQSAALGVGYICSIKNEKVPLGFIGAVKNLKIFSLPLVGDELTTEIQVDYEVFEATLITGKVYCGEKLMAQCEMKIFLKPNE